MTMIPSSLRQRKSDDLKLTLIMVVVGLALVFITPFMIYRLISGEYLVAASHTIMIGAALIFAVHALRTGQTRTPGMIISTIFTAGAVFVTLSKGVEGVLWFYPLITCIFHLTPPGLALILVAGSLCVVTLSHIFGLHIIFPSTVLLFAFLATCICVSTFSYAFANRIAWQRNKLQDLAARDGLTNLKNRRNMDNELSLAIAAKREKDLDLGLVILDLDNLKEINDRMGHSRGDRILVDLARLITHSIRSSDQAFRYGGDEFVILLTNVTAQGLEEVCRNLHETVNANLRCEDTPVTVSMGAALLGPTDDTKQWLRKADACLYQAKNCGRNRFKVHC